MFWISLFNNCGTSTTAVYYTLYFGTGAAGNVGTELVKQLSTVGAIFRAGVHANKSADKIGKISSRAQLIEMDYDKPETLRTRTRLHKQHRVVRPSISFMP